MFDGRAKRATRLQTAVRQFLIGGNPSFSLLPCARRGRSSIEKSRETKRERECFDVIPPRTRKEGIFWNSNEVRTSARFRGPPKSGFRQWHFNRCLEISSLPRSRFPRASHRRILLGAPTRRFEFYVLRIYMSTRFAATSSRAREVWPHRCYTLFLPVRRLCTSGSRILA